MSPGPLGSQLACRQFLGVDAMTGEPSEQRRIILVGGGGHARVLAAILDRPPTKILGYTDPARGETELQGYKLIGDDAAILQYSHTEVELVNGLGSTGIPRLRSEVFKRFKRKGFTFATVVHPSAIVAKNVELGEGVQVMAGAVVQTGCRIGNNTIVNTSATIDHDCRIGESVHIAPGVTLSGGVRVGNLVHAGTGAVVIQDVRVGSRSVLGAGAVVVNDIPESVTVVGVPARVSKNG